MLMRKPNKYDVVDLFCKSNILSTPTYTLFAKNKNLTAIILLERCLTGDKETWQRLLISLYLHAESIFQTDAQFLNHLKQSLSKYIYKSDVSNKYRAIIFLLLIYCEMNIKAHGGEHFSTPALEQLHMQLITQCDLLEITNPLIAKSILARYAQLSHDTDTHKAYCIKHNTDAVIATSEIVDINDAAIIVRPFSAMYEKSCLQKLLDIIENEHQHSNIRTFKSAVFILACMQYFMNEGKWNEIAETLLSNKNLTTLMRNRLTNDATKDTAALVAKAIVANFSGKKPIYQFSYTLEFILHTVDLDDFDIMNRFTLIQLIIELINSGLHHHLQVVLCNITYAELEKLSHTQSHFNKLVDVIAGYKLPDHASDKFSEHMHLWIMLACEKGNMYMISGLSKMCLMLPLNQIQKIILRLWNDANEFSGYKLRCILTVATFCLSHDLLSLVIKKHYLPLLENEQTGEVVAEAMAHVTTSMTYWPAKRSSMDEKPYLTPTAKKLLLALNHTSLLDKVKNKLYTLLASANRDERALKPIFYGLISIAMFHESTSVQLDELNRLSIFAQQRPHLDKALSNFIMFLSGVGSDVAIKRYMDILCTLLLTHTQGVEPRPFTYTAAILTFGSMISKLNSETLIQEELGKLYRRLDQTIFSDELSESSIDAFKEILGILSRALMQLSPSKHQTIYHAGLKKLLSLLKIEHDEITAIVIPIILHTVNIDKIGAELALDLLNAICPILAKTKTNANGDYVYRAATLLRLLPADKVELGMNAFKVLTDPTATHALIEVLPQIQSESIRLKSLEAIMAKNTGRRDIQLSALKTVYTSFRGMMELKSVYSSLLPLLESDDLGLRKASIEALSHLAPRLPKVEQQKLCVMLSADSCSRGIAFNSSKESGMSPKAVIPA